MSPTGHQDQPTSPPCKANAASSQAPTVTVPTSSSGGDEFKGIEVVEIKNATATAGEPQFAIQINCLALFKSVPSWMKPTSYFYSL